MVFYNFIQSFCLSGLKFFTLPIYKIFLQNTPHYSTRFWKIIYFVYFIYYKIFKGLFYESNLFSIVLIFTATYLNFKCKVYLFIISELFIMKIPDTIWKCDVTTVYNTDYYFTIKYLMLWILLYRYKWQEITK